MFINLPTTYITQRKETNTKNKTQQKLTTIIQDLKDKNFQYQQAKPKPTNWTNYDLAQTCEINDVLCFIRDIVDKAAYNLNLPDTQAPRNVGRPSHNPVDQTKVLLMAQYFGLPNRGAYGYMLLFKEKLCLTTIFSYKTIERAYNNGTVSELLDEVFELTHMPVRDLEHDFGPDGTGLTTSCKQNYETDRAKNQISEGYEKIVVSGVLSTSLFQP